MQTLAKTEVAGPTTGGNRRLAAARALAQWLAASLARRATPATSHRSLVLVIGASLFLIAVGVRWLHWQDVRAELTRGEPWMPDLVRQYKAEARRINEGGGLLFPREPVDPGDARPLLHPPGYSLLMAAVFSAWGESSSAVRWAQIIADGLAVVMVFLIAAELLNAAIAAIAGLLAALSPHLAFYALWLSPDSLAVLPILAAAYLVIRAGKRPRLVTVIAAGAMIGVSCWLRANALMLAPLLALAMAVVMPRGRRLGYGLMLVAATAVVIAPVTIRNAILYHHFIPLSIAGGENLVVGIGDVDKEGRFGMPTSDREAARKDAEWHNRPEYARNPWAPDGIERDQYRYARGLQVIGAHPFWFAGMMLRRAGFMLSYNDAGRADWPFNTSRVPIISAEPGVAHTTASLGEAPPVWSMASSGWVAGDAVLSAQTDVAVAGDSQTIRVAGDASEFGDQLASAPVAIEPKTDYLLVLKVKAEQGRVAAKVTSADRRITLAAAALDSPTAEKPPGRSLKSEVPGRLSGSPADEEEMSLLEVMFASGDRNAVRLVISNDGPASSPHVARLGRADLFKLGATAYQWTRYPRAVIRGVQKNLFKTAVMLPLVVAGMVLLGLAGRGRALAVLLAVPVYYLCAQSALSTEYRYILAMHYFLFILSGATLYWAGTVVGRTVWWFKARGEPRGSQSGKGAAEQTACES